jgi:hypothetical protein
MVLLRLIHPVLLKQSGFFKRRLFVSRLYGRVLSEVLLLYVLLVDTLLAAFQRMNEICSG